jgi:hypothetical protein
MFLPRLLFDSLFHRAEVFVQEIEKILPVVVQDIDGVPGRVDASVFVLVGRAQEAKEMSRVRLEGKVHVETSILQEDRRPDSRQEMDDVPFHRAPVGHVHLRIETGRDENGRFEALLER